MKQSKKLLSLLLVFVMALSLTNGFTAKAATTITVTLRVEQDAATLVAPVSVTLTEDDKNNDFGIGLDTGDDAVLSPLRAYAKYLAVKKGVTNEDMSKYIIASESSYGGLYVTGLNTDGKSDGAAGVDFSVSWMYTVNDIEASVGMSQYALKDKDSVNIYGLWYSADNETLYSVFDKQSYETTEKTALTVSLTGKGTNYDENWNPTPYTKPIADATILAAEYKDENSAASETNAVLKAVTDNNGKSTLTFTKAGKYVISAYRKASDGIHYDISRPYAIVTVKEAAAKPNDTDNKDNTDKKDTDTKDTDKDNKTTDITDKKDTASKVKKPAKVTKVKAVPKKSKAKKKSVKISWKNVTKADGYRIYTSKKKNKNYKKAVDVKKNSKTIKLKKGTYYIKVRAYKKSGKTKILGAYSNPVRVKVK